jgi:hypothetical protein
MTVWVKTTVSARTSPWHDRTVSDHRSVRCCPYWEAEPRKRESSFLSLAPAGGTAVVHTALSFTG